LLSNFDPLSRNFTMSKTYTLPANTVMAAAFEQAKLRDDQKPGDVVVTLPSDPAPSDLPPVVIQAAPAKKIDSFFDFIDLLSTTPQARRYAMWATANLLNNFIIANCQAHLRSEAIKLREVNQDVEFLSELGLDQNTIDRFNEQKALLDELRANSANLLEQGFEVPVPAIETAERLVNVRSYIADKMKATATTMRDLAQPIAESIVFRLSKTPAVDEKMVMRWHIACDGKIPVEELRRVSLKQQLTDRQQLLDQSGQIVDLAKTLAWKSIPNEAELEGVFDALPVHVRYRLIGGVVRTLNVAMANEVAAFIRFNRLDSISNRAIIQAALDGYITFFKQFSSDNADALIAYEERGSRLPVLDELLADKSV